MADKQVPELRFKGFTEDWEQRKIKTIGKTFTGLSGKTKDDFGHGEAKYIPYTNIFNNPITNVDQLESIEIDKKQNSVAYGDILFTTSSETPEEVGMSSVWMYEKENVYLNSFCFGFRPIEKHYPLYLAYLLRSPDMRKKFMLLAQGISRYNISKNKVLELAIPLPVISEQIKIGNTLKNLDDTIALHHHKLELLKQAKQGFLQQMFPKEGENVPELRFANFSEAWEQRKLKEISEKVTNKNKEIEFTETLTNSAEFGIISQTDFFDKEISNKKNIDGYYIVKPDDFVYNPRISNYAPVGPIKRNNLGRTGIMSPLYYVFTTKEINKDFLEKYFDSTNWHKFMKLNGDSGARSDRFAIKDSIFVEMPISCPSSKEQQAIGQFFKQIDDTITLYQQKLTDLETLKQAYLQKMFI